MKRGTGRKILFGVGAAIVIWYAVQGGEYGTSDLLSQRGREARLRVEIDSLERVIDSLARYKQRVETDAALQERIAREEYGMVRGSKELLYRLVEPRDTLRQP